MLSIELLKYYTFDTHIIHYIEKKSFIMFLELAHTPLYGGPTQLAGPVFVQYVCSWLYTKDYG